MTWLLYLFGAYLAVCYVWAMYLVVRLYTGKRLRVLVFGNKGETRAMRAAARAARKPSFTTTAQPAASRSKAAA